jgi:hypothetical protein
MVVGFTNREKLLAGLVIIVVVVALLWGKIKSWLHKKTE